MRLCFAEAPICVIQTYQEFEQNDHFLAYEMMYKICRYAKRLHIMTYSQLYKNYEIKPHVVTDLGNSESGARSRHGRILGAWENINILHINGSICCCCESRHSITYC